MPTLNVCVEIYMNKKNKIFFFYMYFPVLLSKPVWGSDKDSSYFKLKYFLK